jgi:hypothetical protein
MVAFAPQLLIKRPAPSPVVAGYAYLSFLIASRFVASDAPPEYSPYVIVGLS